ncbi:hypothetical protein [Sulfurivermis fontis]|uniref:hypothetical protein n=1 Tax=Sulfurivermis fontis TaxID=1972068 RepID=UPI000FD9D0FE|nr:hypothetical protein [Sulfurivermis fontis]
MRKLGCAVAMCVIATTVSAENVVVKQAREAGVKRCMPAIEKIANFLIGDGNAGVHSVWNSDNPDKQAFSAVIERNYSDGAIVTNLNVTPVPTGQCYVEYEKIIQFNKSCLAAAQEFKGAEYKGEVNKEVGALNHNGVHVYLIPSGTNCIVVRKEIIMDGLKL